MNKQEIEKHISTLKAEKNKLFKVKSASPKEITERVAGMEKRISILEEKLKATK
jgi:hypothetical protein